MISKTKHREMKLEEVIHKFYYDDYDTKSLEYKKEAFIPNKSFYENYFKQNQKSIPFKFLTISVMSYVIGLGFGLFMLAFQSMGSGMGMINPLDEKKYKYENLKEVSTAMKTTLKQSVHRNGVFMVRFSLALALFNAIAIYIPNIHPRFGHFYGYGNLDTVFYFAMPTFIMMKFSHISILKRFIYSSIIMTLYTTFRILYVKEYRDEFVSFLNFNKKI